MLVATSVMARRTQPSPKLSKHLSARRERRAKEPAPPLDQNTVVLHDVVVHRSLPSGVLFQYIYFIPLLAIAIGLAREGMIGVFNGSGTYGAFFIITFVLVFVLVRMARKILRTPAVFRFYLPERTLTFGYPFGRRKSFSVEDIEMYSVENGTLLSKERMVRGPVDRIMQFRSGRMIRFTGLHRTRLTPEGFDHIMKEWGIPAADSLPGAILDPGRSDPANHFRPDPQGQAAFIYKPHWGNILLGLVMVFSFLCSGLWVYFELRMSIAGAVRAFFMVALAALIATAILRAPIRATLCQTHLELGYLIGPRQLLPWSSFSGYTRTRSRFRPTKTNRPHILLHLKSGQKDIILRRSILGISDAPFTRFGVIEREGPDPSLSPFKVRREHP